MLKDTGERLIPENMKITNNLLLEHIARYHFSIPHVSGRVLDFASGCGYGTHIIAKTCKNKIEEIVGVDIEQNAIEYAIQHYYHPLSTFQREDATDLQLPAKLGQFDTILSFETLEHVKEEEKFLKNIFNLLKPNGKLILSTPFGEGRGIPCGSPFHVHQLTVKEFQNLFEPYLEKEFFFQKGVLVEPAEHAREDYYPLGLVVCKK